MAEGHRRKHKIYSNPLGKLKLLWNKLYGCCRCCSHIPRRRRGKGKVDRLIPEVASASASAIAAEHPLHPIAALCILSLLSFKSSGKISVDSKWRSRWGNLLLLLHNLLLRMGLRDGIIHFMQLTPQICSLKRFVFYKSLRIFLPGLRFSPQLFTFLLFSFRFSILFALLCILKDKEIWFY